MKCEKTESPSSPVRDNPRDKNVDYSQQAGNDFILSGNIHPYFFSDRGQVLKREMTIGFSSSPVNEKTEPSLFLLGDLRIKHLLSDGSALGSSPLKFDSYDIQTVLDIAKNPNQLNDQLNGYMKAFLEIQSGDYKKAMEITALMIEKDLPAAEAFFGYFIEYLRVKGGSADNVILASQSPRRKEILSELLKNQFTTIPADIEEYLPKKYSYENEMMMLALWKALVVVRNNNKGIVISCDTEVKAGDVIIGKLDKADKKSVLEKLLAMQKNTIKAVTAVAVINTQEAKVKLGHEAAELTLKGSKDKLDFDDRETLRELAKKKEFKYLSSLLKQSEITVSNILESYINNGRYIGKAGGFGIQDRDFFLVVRQVMGNPMTIVGLPVEIIFDILKDFNVPMKYFDFLNKYWPSQIEQRKIFPVAKKEEYVSKKRDALSRQETEYAEEIKKVKDSFDPGKSEQLINLYCKLILALQYAYRLGCR